MSAAARSASDAPAAPAFALGIGLAGGIDKDGGRAGELLAVGFASVEFGSVAAGIGGFPDTSAAVLAARLADWRAAPASGHAPRIGVGLSRPSAAPTDALADCWLAGFDAVAAVADYVSLNLTAAANRPLLMAENRPLLARSFAAVVARRDALDAGAGRVALAVKLPLGTAGEPLPSLVLLAAAAGVDQLTLVRADGASGFARLAALAQRLRGGPALVAVGGIRTAADVAAARDAGAAGVQVHRVFVEQGMGCLTRLRLAARSRIAGPLANDQCVVR